MAKRRNPKRWTEAWASHVLDEADGSGLSDRAFGKRRGIDPQRLSFWRQRLGRKRERGAKAPAFVEVRAAQGVPAMAIEIQLTNGRVVKAPTTIDVGVLRELLDAVEGRAC